MTAYTGEGLRKYCRAASAAETEEEPMNGAEMIAAERARQQSEEGYDAEHDRGHANELAHAGAAYALADEWRGSVTQSAPPVWPWDAIYWKPTPDDRIRELVKAGALIAAAIDSLHPASDGGPESRLREAARAVVRSWDAGDLDTNYDRIASAFDSLRAALDGRCWCWDSPEIT